MTFWIPVAERLPLELTGQTYQTIGVWVSDGENVGYTEFQAGGFHVNQPWRHFASCDSLAGPVTHWQPAPKAPSK